MTTTTRTDLELSVLGTFTTSHAGGQFDLGGRLQRSVLALLVATGGGRVSNDELLVGVWSEDVAGDRLRSLQTYVSNLRAIVGDVIDRQGDGQVWATVIRGVSHLDEVAIASLTRGYTTEECVTCGLDACPTTLEQVIERYRGVG